MSDLIYRSIKLPFWLDRKIEDAATRNNKSFDDVLIQLMTPIFGDPKDDDDEIPSTLTTEDDELDGQ